LKNGDLLQRAKQAFYLFVTSDQNLRYQQTIRGQKIAILELSTNKLRRIEAAKDLVHSAVTQIKPGEFRQLQIP